MATLLQLLFERGVIPPQASAIPAPPIVPPASSPASLAQPRSLRSLPSTCRWPCDPAHASRQTSPCPLRSSKSLVSLQLRHRACVATRLQSPPAQPAVAAKWLVNRILPAQ